MVPRRRAGDFMQRLLSMVVDSTAEAAVSTVGAAKSGPR
jgi:hypothetical protein